VQAQLIVRAEARCSVPKNVQIRSIAESAIASAAVFDPQNKKARQILADPSGYLAVAEPASSMVRRKSRYITRP
jgi:acetyl-CoA carboxylase carboxyltransferase component